MTPVLRDPVLPLVRRRSFQILAAAVVVLAVGMAMFVYEQFYRTQPGARYESDEDHFLFASVGTEADAGVPYWIWLVLPRIFPDLLPRPGGYAGLGVISKPGYQMPIGLSTATIGYARVGVNCALCHAASVRLSPESVPTIVPAAPAHQTAAQQYLRFLADAAADPRFTADAILGEISKNTRLSLTERLLYRVAIIPSTRRALLRLREDSAWMHTRPEWGPGRVDLFTPITRRAVEQPPPDSIATADMPPLWNLAARRPAGGGYFWDGMNADLREVVYASALAGGASVAWLDGDFRQWDNSDRDGMSSLRRVTNYLNALPAPRYPLPVDSRLAGAGAEVFRTACASCHAPGEERFGQVIAAAEVGTDRHRLDAMKAGAAALNEYGEDRDWAFSGFRATDGYVAPPLDGLWLRAPYLHNGSVPSLAELLEPPDRRPGQFWRGYDLFDPLKVGFVSQGAEAERSGSRYDTSRPGNSNVGHTYGTTLAPDAKRALIEYLKSL